MDNQTDQSAKTTGLIKSVRQYIDQQQEWDTVSDPAPAAAIQQSERGLGFGLPSLLQQLYMHVGNGGFGPGYGLIGLDGGALEEGKTVLEFYRSCRQVDPDDPFWAWPEQLLPICHWGCGIYSCLDCSDPDAPVVVFDPNQHEYREDGTPSAWDSSFFVHRPSFASWIEAWVAGVDLWSETRRRGSG